MILGTEWVTKILWTTCILIGWTSPSLSSSPLDSSSDLPSYDVVLFESRESTSCVAAGKDLQTAMIFPRENETVSSFVPMTSYSCTFQKEEPCAKKWVEKGWTLTTSDRVKFGYVFDRRWEKFPLKTGRIYKDTEPYTFNKEADDIDGDFEIPISVKAQKDAHLFFCDEKSDQNISTSSCYWIIIGGWNGYISAIRKCSGVKGQVPSLNNFNSCNNDYLKTHYNHTSDNTALSLSEWKHFTIKKEKNMLSVSRPNDNKNYMEWKDDEPPYKVKNFFVSLRGYGGYKIHRDGLIYTTEEKSFSLGELKEYRNGNEFCMAIFIKMCPSCKLKIELTYANGEKESMEVNYKGEWQEYVVRKEKRNIKNVQFETKGGEDKYWAISEVRSCSQKDVRVIRGSTNNKQCVLLNKKDGVQFSISANLLFQDVQYQSSGDTFDIGNEAYPCSVLGNANSDTCGSAKICRQYPGQVRCSCTWGYYFQNGYCSGRCGNSYFGFNCKEKCGYCEHINGNYHNGCMHETGKCPDGCFKGYKGQYCKETSSISNLRQIGENTTQIKLTWDVIANSQISNYKINYAHVKYNACQNKNPSIIRSLEAKGPDVIIEGLLPYSTYQVNVTGFYNKQENEEVMPDRLEAELVTSPTAAVSEEERPEISLEVTHESVKITPKVNCENIKGEIRYSINTVCTNEWCKPNNDSNSYETSGGSVKINGLIPYSNYKMNIKIHRPYSKESINLKEESFTTKASAPNRVTDLVAYSKSGEYIFLRWKPPYPPNGVLENVEVTQSNKVIKTIEPKACKIWKDHQCIKLSGIQANSLYTIIINPKNKEVETRTTSNSIQVQAKSSISDPPKNVSAYFDDEDKLHVKWEHPNKTNGELTHFNLYFRAGGNNNSNQKRTVLATEAYSEKLFFEKVADNFTFPYYSSIIVECAAKNSAGESQLAQTEVTTPPERPVFESKPIGFPKISDTSASITYPIQNVLIRKDVNSSSSIILFGGSRKPNAQAEPDEVLKKICQVEDKVAWIEPFSSKSGSNPPSIDVVDLEPGTSYGVCVVLRNSFKSYTRYSTTTSTFRTSGDTPITEETNPALYAFIVLLLIVPVILWVVWRRKKREPLWPFKTNKITVPNPDVIPLTGVPTSETTPTRTKPTLIVKPKLKQPIAEDPTKYSKPVPLNGLEAYVKEAISSGELEKQHALFPRGQTKPWTYGVEKPNKFKNRYANLAAYDHTRVVLEKISGDHYSDYINANFIQGYSTPKAYIATQGPKPATVNDFWRMMWQEEVHYVVMLANVIEGEKKKSEQYWPNINQSQFYGNITVTFTKSDLYADYEYRTLLVQKGDEQRTIQQLHFTSWPDHGVPLYTQSLVPFLQRMLTLPQDKPIVVHCSAGVGRTGTIILSDICLRMAAAEGKVDILWHQYQLREQRVNMVDNLEQYKLVHMLLLDCLFAPKTAIECDNNFEGNVDRVRRNEIQKQLDYLQRTMWQDQVMRAFISDDEARDFPEKNRFQDIVPDACGRIFISRYPSGDESSSYINAVRVDGFHLKNRYIVTQQPLPDTVGDFWRLVDEHKSSIVVSLNSVTGRDQSCPKFWPTEQSPEMTPVPYLVLEHVQTIKSPIYDSITIHVLNKDRTEEERTLVQVMLFKKWPFENFVPNKVENFLTLCEEVDRLARAGGPVVVTCYDGARASGLFAAATFMIEKIKLEQQCDVCLAVRVIRHNRKQFVQNREQFMYLYEVAAAYISGFETYSNFTSK